MPGLRFKIDFCLRRFAGFSSRLDVREGYSGMQSGLVEVKLADAPTSAAEPIFQLKPGRSFLRSEALRGWDFGDQKEVMRSSPWAPQTSATVSLATNCGPYCVGAWPYKGQGRALKSRQLLGNKP